MIDILKAPFPIRYRELWLPGGIRDNAVMPSSKYDGHPVTLTGAIKATSCEGVLFDGSATSNVNCGVIHNNAATYWLNFRFKFTSPYAAGSGNMYIWGKFLDATHFLWLVFKTADGKLYFEGQDGGANDFSIAAQDGGADITSWNAGQFYNILASISALNGVRLRVNNGTVVTSASAIAFPNGGDFVYGDYDDPGAGTGFKGVIVDFYGGTDNLTAGEETYLYAGLPPDDQVNQYKLDAGRGVTATDRGSGGNNGTLDTSARWSFKDVAQPLLSFDSRNGRGVSPGGIDRRQPVTIIWVVKAKSSYPATPARYYAALDFHGADGTHLMFQHANADGMGIGAAQMLTVIDGYYVAICAISEAGVGMAYANGTLLGTVGLTSYDSNTTLYIGDYSGASRKEISSPLLVALADGAFTGKQALTYTRWIKDIFNLPISI